MTTGGCGNGFCALFGLRFARLTIRAIWTLAAIATLTTVRTILPFLTLWPLLALLAFGLVLTLRALFVLLMRDGQHNDDVVIVIAVHIVAVTVIAVFAAIVALETFLHLRLGGCDDTVIMFGVLQVVFRHDAVAGALSITCERGVLFRNMLGSAANLHIGAGTIIGSGQRISTLYG